MKKSLIIWYIQSLIWYKSEIILFENITSNKEGIANK
jgi:hypothetical protein